LEAETRRHTQYFEIFGHRAIYHEGWRADCGWPGPDYATGAKKGRNPPFRFTGTVRRITIDVSREAIKDAEAEMRRALAKQ